MKNPARHGLLTKKVGMTRIFNAEGQHIPVTVLQVENEQVIAQRTTEKDGYTAIQVGAFPKKESRVAKPEMGHFKKANAQPKQKLVEFRVKPEDLLPVGTELKPSHFTEGQLVDVRGVTKGRGFTGVMARWNFRGLRATHGVSISHRSHGSTGMRQDPGRVFKNKKMAGHYGVENICTQNLQVVRVDDSRGLLLIKGSVPGANGGFVIVNDAVKTKKSGSGKPALKPAK
ncbi:MAG: 50S ribosomal protein L3 [Proteobacteria bacterium]|nr:50S ribosomal protein L3 [Pseudomonadota bacterium]NBX85754.1 50S ribosomal protein L3 [Pseudomonadota bacterium]